MPTHYDDPNYCNKFKGDDKTYCENENRRAARLVEIRLELRAAGYDVDEVDKSSVKQDTHGLHDGDLICPATYGGFRDYSRSCYVIERR